MTPQDETELRRLTDMLRSIGTKLEHGSELDEGLSKAGLALHMVFTNGMRADLERIYGKLGTALTEEENAYLRSLGIEP